MRAQRKNREEQYQLILECRQSGLSDYKHLWIMINLVRCSHENP